MAKRSARDHRLARLGEEAMRALGAGHAERAEAIVDEAIALAPGLAPALAIRASAGVRLRKYEQAERDILAALRGHPSPPPQWTVTLSLIHRGRGELDRAIVLLQEAHVAHPASQIVTSNLGELLATIRRHEEAFSLLSQAVSRGADRPGLLAQFGRVCRFLGKAGEAVEPLSRVAAIAEQTTVGRQQVLFELGAVLDSLGRYDEAFEAYRRANGLEARAFDIEAQGRAVDEIIQTWTRDAFGAHAGVAGAGEGLVFIVGMRRSGTTLAEQILAAHPRVCAGGELPWLRASAKGIDDETASRLGMLTNLAGCTPEAVESASQAYTQQADAARGSAAVFTDKMPANFKLLGLVQLALPAAKVIWCRRDPADTCLSCYMQPFNDNSYCADLRTLARYHHDCERLMTHWQDQLDLPIFELSYEALVANPGSTVRGLLGFLGLPFDEACLHFERSSPAARTASTDQVARGLYTTSVHRAEQYRAHLAPLYEELDRLVHQRRG